MRIERQRCVGFLLACLAVALAIQVAQAQDTAPATRPAIVKVAAVQCSSDLGDVEGNRKKLTALIEESAARGAKIIVLPEAAITGYLSQDLKTNWHVPGKPMEREALMRRIMSPQPPDQLCLWTALLVPVPLIVAFSWDAGNGSAMNAIAFNRLQSKSMQFVHYAHFIISDK